MANLFLNSTLDELSGYFVGDAIAKANNSIIENVRVAWSVLNSTTASINETVNSSETQLIVEYAPNTLADWTGGARVVVHGTSLSADLADPDYTISSIDLILTDSESPTDWARPLVQVSLGVQMTVVSGRATSLGITSLSVDAGGIRVKFTGSIQFDSVSNSAEMQNSRLEIEYDSDPGEGVVFSRIYIEGALSFNGETGLLDGTFKNFGFISELGPSFYGTDLDITAAELRAMPDNLSVSDVLRWVFNGGGDTLYTSTDIFLPEGFEKAVIEGNGNVALDANGLNNFITGNSGNNIVNGNNGSDTFITAGFLRDSSAILNIDGSISLFSQEGGLDRLSSIEFIRFSDGSFPVLQTIDSAEVSYAVDVSSRFSIQLPRTYAGDGIVNLPSYTSNTYNYAFTGFCSSDGSTLTAEIVGDGSILRVTKRLSDGSLDLSFGFGGALEISHAGGNSLAVVEEKSKNILLAVGGNSGSSVYRIDPFTGITVLLSHEPLLGGILDILTTSSGYYVVGGYSPGPNILSFSSEGGLLNSFSLSSGSGNRYVVAADLVQDNGVWILSRGWGYQDYFYLDYFSVSGEISQSVLISPAQLTQLNYFSSPLDIVCDVDGNVYVAIANFNFSNKAESFIEIRKYNAAGLVVEEFGANGAASLKVSDFVGRASITIDPNQNIVLAASQSGSTLVAKFNTSGNVDKIYSALNAPLGIPSAWLPSSTDLVDGGVWEQPMWMSTDSSGRVYVGLVDISPNFSSTYSASYLPVIVRFDAQGSLDSSFDELLPTYTLSSYGGGAVPSWIEFDTDTLTISGSPSSADLGDHFLTLSANSGGRTGLYSFSVQPTMDLAPYPADTVLEGIVYHWKSHELLSGVTVSARGGEAPLEGNQAPIQLKNLTWNAAGEATVELWATAASTSQNLGFELDLGAGTQVFFTQDSILANWFVEQNAMAGGFSLVAITGDANSALAAGSYRLGALSFNTGAAQQAQIGLLAGEVGDTVSTTYGLNLARTVTDNAGGYSITQLDPGSYSLQASRATTDTGYAITSADALAALKIAVGLNPNATINGVQAKISPYQIMAADVVGTDGKVSSADALAILRMAVKLPTAPVNEWMFVEEMRDFWNESANNGQGAFTLTRTSTFWVKTITAFLEDSKEVNLVGVLKGDVNGSWLAPEGSQDLDVIDPVYFQNLSTLIGAPLDQWGIV